MKVLQHFFQPFHKMSFYAVAKGVKVGIYDTWVQCEIQVKNFKGAKYKKFPTRQQAEIFIQENCAEAGSTEAPQKLRRLNEIISEKNCLEGSTKYSPHDIVVALGDKKSFPGNREPTKKQQVADFWPECDGDEMIEGAKISDDELLNALAEVEGYDNLMPDAPTTSSMNTGIKRKALDNTLQSTIKKHASEELKPIGLKKIGAFEFQIDADGFVIVYTDGSCINNGRVGAVAGLGVYFGDNHPLNAAKPVRGRVTNNAGEIQAAIHAIRVAIDLNIPKLCISTDSQFLINSITMWISAWKKKNWRLSNGEPVKNVDDFKMLDKLLSDHTLLVKWNYVKAHKGIKGNEMADKLAKEGSEHYKLLNNL